MVIMIQTNLAFSSGLEMHDCYLLKFVALLDMMKDQRVHYVILGLSISLRRLRKEGVVGSRGCFEARVVFWGRCKE